MLKTIAGVLIVLWLLVIAGSYTMGGWIHILPVTAVILVLIDVIQERRSPGKRHIGKLSNDTKLHSKRKVSI